MYEFQARLKTQGIQPLAIIRTPDHLSIELFEEATGRPFNDLVFRVRYKRAKYLPWSSFSKWTSLGGG